MKKVCTLIFGMLFCSLIYAQTQNPDYKSYIETYKDIAIREMELYKIPASITLAQGIIESNCGKSSLAVNANNHFGIKCTKEWTGETFYYDDDKEDECFRKYRNYDESFRDHSIFLVSRSRYAALFTLPIDDYKGWATGLKQAGYATNPEYANILIRVIEENKLYEFDYKSGIIVSNKQISEDVVSDKDVNIRPVADQPAANPDNAKAAEIITHSDVRYLYRDNYPSTDLSKYKFLYTANSGRKVYENNGLPFIIGTVSDTWQGIAKEFGLYTFQAATMNDLTKRDAVPVGKIIYLEPKKKRGQSLYHKTEKWDSMYSISQQYGIKLKWLYQYNKLVPGDEPNAGTAVRLAY